MGKRWLKSKGWAVLTLAVVLTMTACSGNSGSGGGNQGAEPSSATETAAAGEAGGAATTLSIMWWGSDARHEATKKRWTSIPSNFQT